MKKLNIQMSESMTIGLCLAFAGGFMDAYSFLLRGEVFANAQTGNIVLLGIMIAKSEWLKALFYFIPIISFVLGVTLSEIIKSKYKNMPTIHWRQIIIFIEIIVLIIVGFIPLGYYNPVANVLVSLVCALQVQSFRKLHGLPFATTMCTGNLRSATEHLYKYQKLKDKPALYKSLKYFSVILFFILGALIGSFIINVFKEKSVWFTVLIFTAVLLVLFINPIDSDDTLGEDNN